MNRAQHVWIATVVVAVAACVVTPAGSWARFTVWCAVSLATVVILVTVTVRRNSWAPSAWGFAAAGVASTAAAIAYTLSHHAAGPPSIHAPDWIELAFTIVTTSFWLAATFTVARPRLRQRPDATTVLDAAAVFVAGLLVLATFYLVPTWSLTSSVPQRITIVVSQILLLVLLIICVRILVRTTKIRSRASRLLASGILGLLFATVLTLYYSHPATPLLSDAAGTFLVVVVLVSIAVIALGALDSSAPAVPRFDPGANSTAHPHVLVLLGVCVVLPPVVLLVTAPHSFAGEQVFIILTVVIAAIVGARVYLIILRFRRAIDRERELRQINSGLMLTNSVADVDARLSDWAVTLVGQLRSDCHLVSLPELTDLGVSRSSVSEAISGERGVRYATVVPVLRTASRQYLLLITPSPVGPAEVGAIAALGQSVGMTLERIALTSRILERATNERLNMLLHNATDVIVLIDSTHRIRFINDAVGSLIRQEPVDITGTKWHTLFAFPDEADRLLAEARRNDEAQAELIMAPTDPLHRFESLSLTQIRPHPDESAESGTEPARVEVSVVWLEHENQFVATLHDVTQRHALLRELQYRAYHDELTGLRNRSCFRRELDEVIMESHERQQAFAVMMIDLDDFKDINDSLGHPAGDEYLRTVADRLSLATRAEDVPYRLGGDEFAVIVLNPQSRQEAQAYAEQLISILGEPADLSGVTISAGASIGIAFSAGAVDPTSIERDADIALYEAKYGGKGRVAIFHSDMHSAAVDKLTLTGALHDAVSQGEMVVRYQPIVNLATGEAVGLEALVRWMHPTRGEIVPESFVQLAEQSGFIIDIGEHVADRALRDLRDLERRNPDASKLRVNLNVSVRQLERGEIAAALRAGLRASGISADRIVVEVTESIFVSPDSRAAAQMAELRDLGIRLYLDDFGTGWASLTYLRRLPIDGMKLAQEFVHGLPNDYDRRLIRSIRRLSTALGMEDIIAEGVETETQRTDLLTAGYRLGQGFLFAGPLEIKEVRSFLHRKGVTSWSSLAPDVPVPTGDRSK